MMSRLIFLILLISNQIFADHVKIGSYDVIYRDYLGNHRVEGKKVNAHTYQYNTGADKQLILSTLDWKPYIGEQICRQGWVLQTTIALLHSLGYGATVTFYPWARAVAFAEQGKADILFPEYFIEPEAPSDIIKGTRRLDHLVLSDAFGWGPIAFIKRKDYDTNHVIDLQSLINERIGVVRGYQNTPEFDRLMDAGNFKIVEAKDDLNNVNLLLFNRVNLIIGDPEVINAAIKNSALPKDEKQSMLTNIQVIDPIIKMNGLFYALSKNNQYTSNLLVELNQAISSFKKQGVIEEIRYHTRIDCANIKNK